MTPTGATTAIALDDAQSSEVTLGADGAVTGTVGGLMHLTIEQRAEGGCGALYLTQGFSQFPLALELGGAVGAGGLGDLQLVAKPAVVTVWECLQRGDPALPCSNSVFLVPLPLMLSADLRTSVVFGP